MMLPAILQIWAFVEWPAGLLVHVIVCTYIRFRVILLCPILQDAQGSAGFCAWYFS